VYLSDHSDHTRETPGHFQSFEEKRVQVHNTFEHTVSSISIRKQYMHNNTMHSFTTSILLLVATTVSSTDWLPQLFLRGSATSASTSASASASSGTVATPYDDLLNCMWNGTTVGVCHSLNCKWCHSTFSDICVTSKYANQLDGAVFHCETSPAPADDDATPPPPDNDDAPPPDEDDTVPVDDDALAPTAPAPTAPAPTAPAPTTPPPPKDDDEVHPVDDDDPNHGANASYMDHLLHCMALSPGMACTKDAICTTCQTPTHTKMCFSHQAARQMEGAYYQCDMKITTTMTTMNIAEWLTKER